MIGRGTRVIAPADFQVVTPDAKEKLQFVVVDAVGVYESVKIDTRPLDKKKSEPLEKLLLSVALGKRDEDTLSTLAGRLARLNRSIDDDDRSRIKEMTGGCELSVLAHRLLDAADPDAHIAKARQTHNTDEPTQEQVAAARDEIVQSASLPFDNPDLRDLLADAKRRSEQVIDTVSIDTVLEAGYDQSAREKAQQIVAAFKTFLDEHHDEITALQIIYSRPHRDRHLTYEVIRELHETLAKPPHNLQPEHIWHAYEQVESGKVARLGADKMLTNIISLVRFAIGEIPVLEPFPNRVEERFQHWLDSQRSAGRKFTDEQLEWLTEVKNHIATSLAMEIDDFDDPPFHAKGGRMRAYRLFGDELDKLLKELNEELAA